MARLSEKNFNFNFNFNSASASSLDVFRFARFNSDRYRYMVDYSDNSFVARNNTQARYPTYWDADLQSYAYLQWFMKENPEWFNDFVRVAKADGCRPAHEMDIAVLAEEVKHILDLTVEREGRFSEVIDQDNADGAVGYWLGMLGVDPVRHPATYLLIRIGRRIGEHVVMCLKNEFAGARPSQLCPAIVPMIDPPATPSFPSGHALQAYLISHLLAGALPGLPQTQVQTSPSDPAARGRGPVYELAARVAENRIVAGVHFRCDNEAGRAVAYECFVGLKKVSQLWNSGDSKSVLSKVREEFRQFS